MAHYFKESTLSGINREIDFLTESNEFLIISLASAIRFKIHYIKSRYRMILKLENKNSKNLIKELIN